MNVPSSLSPVWSNRHRLLFGLVIAAISLLVFVFASSSAYAATISRGEIVTRAWSALGTPYSQTGTHVKSYQPDAQADSGSNPAEPYIDCSGLLQKCWQVDDQKYPGQYPMGTEYNAQAFYDCNYPSLWYQISQDSLVMGDGFSSGSHAIVYTGSISGTWYIIEAAGVSLGTVYRAWPASYNKSSFRAIRRANIEGSYAYDVILDNPTARQRGGPVTYCHSCPYFWDWSKSTNVSGYKGIDYQNHDGTGTGTEATARYTPCLPSTGWYNVYVRYPAYGTYGNNVQIKVLNGYGTATYHVDETVNGGTWRLLGTLYFYSGFHPSYGSLTISTYGTSGSQHVIADAVWFSLQY